MFLGVEGISVVFGVEEFLEVVDDAWREPEQAQPVAEGAAGFSERPTGYDLQSSSEKRIFIHDGQNNAQNVRARPARTQQSSPPQEGLLAVPGASASPPTYPPTPEPSP